MYCSKKTISYYCFNTTIQHEKQQRILWKSTYNHSKFFVTNTKKRYGISPRRPSHSARNHWTRRKNRTPQTTPTRQNAKRHRRRYGYLSHYRQQMIQNPQIRHWIHFPLFIIFLLQCFTVITQNYFIESDGVEQKIIFYYITIMYV